MKRWRYRTCDAAVAERLQAEHHLPRLVATLLAHRDISDPALVTAFLKPDLSQLHDPLRMLGMKPALERLRQAIANQQGILIYGDYDVDGTTAVVLLRKAIELAGGKADFHVDANILQLVCYVHFSLICYFFSQLLMFLYSWDNGNDIWRRICQYHR